MKGILFKPWKIKKISELKDGEFMVTRRVEASLKEINLEPDNYLYLPQSSFADGSFVRFKKRNFDLNKDLDLSIPYIIHRIL